MTRWHRYKWSNGLIRPVNEQEQGLEGLMRLVCPNCAAQYEVDDSAIPDTGRDVQCASCGNTWFQENLAPHFSLPDDTSDDADHDDAEEDDDTRQSPSALGHKQPERDPRVEEILREEADHEARIRSGSSAPTDDEVSDVAQEDADQAPPADDWDDPAAHAPATPTRLTADHERAPGQGRPRRREAAQEPPELEPAPRREADPASGNLPDIEELNASLSPANGPRNLRAAPTPETTSKRRGAGRFGFYLAIFVALVLVALYALGPQISDAVPAAAPYLARFTILVDQARHTLASGFASLIENARNLLGQYL